MSDRRTEISHYQRVKGLNESERAILRGLAEGPGAANDQRSALHLLRLGLIEQFAPQGWLAITAAGRAALDVLKEESGGTGR